MCSYLWLAHVISPFRKRFIRTIQKSFKPQSSSQDDVRLCGGNGLFCSMCLSCSRRLHDVFRRGSIGRYMDRMLKPDCSDISGESLGTSQVSRCVSVHIRLCLGETYIHRSLYVNLNHSQPFEVSSDDVSSVANPHSSL